MALGVDVVTAFMYGLTSSVTLCLVACLPVYLPILFGYGDDAKKGAKLALGFAVGRFIGYFTLGTVAALMGAAFLYFFQNTFPKISTWLVFIFGFLTIFYGIMVLAKAKLKFFNHKSCKNMLSKSKRFDNPFVGSGILGFASTITPCVPVFTFLLLPFALGKVFKTSVITIAFGLGANVVFLAIGILVSFGMKNINQRFHNVKRKLEIFSGITLIVFGMFYILWSTGPILFGWEYQNYVLPTAIDFVDFFKGLLRL
ncbi:MAG: hypothetical protein MAG795_00266 [Candidatus Woesearchaeota archaeon]|nr:hypothetical protein [Candidatus Woesearchaeota archaeon]